MRSYRRWIGIGLGGILLLVFLLVGYVYAASGIVLRRTYHADAHPPAVPTDSAAITEGGRLARILGCYGACHGEAAGGQVIDVPFLAAGAIPDLRRLAREYDDAQLELAIRHGIKPNGRGVVPFMPSEMFSHLSDEDLGSVIAFLRSLPPVDSPEQGLRFRPLARALIAIGKVRLVPQGMHEPVMHLSPDRSDPVAFGRYLALTSCVECHGADLRGSEEGPPDLRIGAAYSLEAFTRLMREGVPLAGREIDLMRDVALGRFSHFTHDEIEALHAYLLARARESLPDTD